MAVRYAGWRKGGGYKGGQTAGTWVRWHNPCYTHNTSVAHHSRTGILARPWFVSVQASLVRWLPKMGLSEEEQTTFLSDVMDLIASFWAETNAGPKRPRGRARA